eukprot:UN30412
MYISGAWQNEHDCSNWEGQPAGWLCEGDGEYNDENNCNVTGPRREMGLVFDVPSTGSENFADVFEVACLTVITFQWEFQPFDACSTDCGHYGGVLTRVATCRGSDGSVGTDADCTTPTNLKPESAKSCPPTPPCGCSTIADGEVSLASCSECAQDGSVCTVGECA